MSKRRWKNHNRRITPVYDKGDESAGMTRQAWQDRGYAVKGDAEGWLSRGMPEANRLFVACEVEEAR